MGNTIGNINSNQEVTMSHICTQINILNHKISYCLSQIDTLKYQFQALENNVNKYDPEDYNEVFYDNRSISSVNNKSESETDIKSTSFAHVNEFTWDYYEFNNAYIKNMETNT